MPKTLTPGVYKHYKGKLYRVIGVATHSETNQRYAIYYPHDEPEQLWMRPEGMFTELINCEGETIPRFNYQHA